MVAPLIIIIDAARVIIAVNSQITPSSILSESWHLLYGAGDTVINVDVNDSVTCIMCIDVDVNTHDAVDTVIATLNRQIFQLGLRHNGGCHVEKRISKPTLSIHIRPLNPLTSKLFNLNFHPLEVVSRWRDPQP